MSQEVTDRGGTLGMMHAHACMSAFVRACMCVCMLVGGGKNATSSVFLNHSTPYILRRDLSLDLELTNLATPVGQ